jgi:hypothetical protein
MRTFELRVAYALSPGVSEVAHFTTSINTAYFIFL